MSYILVLYHSSHGSVKSMAHEIYDAISSCNMQVKLRTFVKQSESDIVVTQDDLIHCQALAFGSPTRFGMMASQAKLFWENTSELWLKGQLIDKPASVFTSSSSMHGGNESTLLTLSLPLLHHGMMLLGVPYDIPELSSTQSGGTPYGASHVSGLGNNTDLSSHEIKICHSVGHRLAKITQQLNK